MWSTRSVNNITVNGQGQGKRTANARGEIVGFKTTPSVDIVVGEAGAAYETPLNRFTRAIIFVKPELVVVYDRLAAKEPSTFEYWLHAVNKMTVKDQHDIQVQNGDVVCDIDFLTPGGLSFKQTDQYDPNPEPSIKLREWHLTGATSGKSKEVEFVTLYRPHRISDAGPSASKLDRIDGGYVLTAKLSGGEFTALLPTDDAKTLEVQSLTTTDTIKLKLEKAGR